MFVFNVSLPFRYLRNKLAIQAGVETADALKAQLEDAQAKIEELEKENEALKNPVEPAGDETVGEELDVPPEQLDVPPPEEIPLPEE